MPQILFKFLYSMCHLNMNLYIWLAFAWGPVEWSAPSEADYGFIKLICMISMVKCIDKVYELITN